MRYNILNKTFIIFALAAFGLTSCKQNGSLDKSEIIGEKANQSLIEAVTKKITEEQNTLKSNTDPSDQYGMKTDLFEKLQNKENTKKYSEDENQNLRKQFYASLNSDKKTIEDFGKIVIQIEKDSLNKGTWPQDLIDGGYKIQAGLENLITQIDAKKEKLNTLASEKMTELKAKFDEIATLKENWIKFVKEVTKDHTDDKDSIKGDVKKLVGYMDPKFKSIKTGLEKIETTTKEAKAILDTIK